MCWWHRSGGLGVRGGCQNDIVRFVVTLEGASVFVWACGGSVTRIGREYCAMAIATTCRPRLPTNVAGGCGVDEASYDNQRSFNSA